MKPKEQKPEEVYRIINRETGAIEGSYSRAYCTEYDFASPEEARNSNVHGEYKSRAKYGIARYRVTYELIDDDVDPPTPEEATANADLDADWAEAKRHAPEGDPYTQYHATLQKFRELRMKREYDRLVVNLEYPPSGHGL